MKRKKVHMIKNDLKFWLSEILGNDRSRHLCQVTRK